MKKLLIALLVLGLIAPGMAMAQNLEQRVDELEENMQDFAKQGMKLKETVIGMKKMGWHFAGSFRTHLGYYDVDQEYVGGPYMGGNIGAGPYDDDSGTILGFSAQSTFGAKAIINENFYGVAQFGLKENSGDSEVNSPYMRLFYGVWDFGSGKLTAGKDYTPGTFLGYSKQAGDVGISGESIMLSTGLPYISRQPQMKLSFGDFDIALIEPNMSAPDYADSMAYSVGLETVIEGDSTTLWGIDPAFFTSKNIDYTDPEQASAVANAAAGYFRDEVASEVSFDKDFEIPRIEAAYVVRLNNDNLRIRPVLGYQTYEVEVIDRASGDTDSESIDSYLAGLGVSADFGPAYVKGTASYMQNPGNYGFYNTGLLNYLNVLGKGLDIPSLSITNAQITEKGVEDATATLGTLVGGFKVNDMLSLEGGFSYMNGEVDLPAAIVYSISKDLDDYESRTAEQTTMTGYLQAWITMTENVSFIPEIGIVNQGDLEIGGLSDIDGGSMTYFDLSCRMDF